MNTTEFRELALSFPGTIEKPHFDKIAFKVVGKRIFTTLDEKNKTAAFRFSETDQSVFCSFDKKTVYPVPNKWGLQGWTIVQVEKVPKELIWDALDTAYKECLKGRK